MGRIVSAGGPKSGIKPASGPVRRQKKGGLPTGGTITTSGGRRIHTFNTVGTTDFVTPIPLTGVNYIVVAGGGGGGSGVGPNAVCKGGGHAGAGGYQSFSNQTINPGTYPVTIGAGGPGGGNPDAGQQSNGSQGGNSSFNGATSIGGGYGGVGGPSWPSQAGGPGGSGGGAGRGNTSGALSGGAGTAGQGVSGAGSNSASGCPGNGGGSAATSSISGSSVTYASGGSGITTPPHNPGDGGNGAVNANGPGLPGDKGIVIISYVPPA